MKFMLSGNTRKINICFQNISGRNEMRFFGWSEKELSIKRGESLGWPGGGKVVGIGMRLKFVVMR
jgi:hypothetical protein